MGRVYNIAGDIASNSIHIEIRNIHTKRKHI